jgi:hypothetical protein
VSRITSDKNLDRLIENYMEKGWQLEDRGKHWSLRSPAGPAVTFSRSPSDRRATLNIRAQLRRVERGWIPGKPAMAP